jgi:hypothetical protein
MRTSRLLPLALACAPLASQPMIGAAAPEVEFKGALNLDAALNLDRASSLSDLTGRLIMLEFFATW